MWAALIFCLLILRNVKGRDLISETREAGYDIQAHKVLTSDGYILTMHQITNKKISPDVKQKPVMFLMHGMMRTSDSFVMQGSKKQLAYTVSDDGYDVWLGNARGNPYSRAHQRLNPDDKADRTAFFNFTCEEIAVYDLAAMVNYIVVKTGQANMRFIGDTLGGTAFLILNSLHPAYNKRFSAAQLLAPLGYTKFFPSAELRAAASQVDQLYAMGKASGILEISSLNPQKTAFPIEVTPLYALQTILTFIANLGGSAYIGASLKQLAHYGQNIRDKAFRRWDYGLADNFKIYGTLSPPNYNLSKVTAYTVLYYGKNNMVLDERDALAMANDMKKAIATKLEDDLFSFEDLVDIARTNDAML